MRKICRTILAAGLMACMMMPAVNVMATDDIVGNWQADEAGVGFAKISASLVGLDGLCININEDNTRMEEQPYLHCWDKLPSEFPEK